ncbi:hypothetical protein BGX21_001639 [Mortierella sp. AD011]|nr:hypothetical protein BGX20_000654 [Mortierella sp. AD010]KAF9383128.1 hypothetical protein BGX21_001639 [Mortierella sp. AD011]
MVKPMGLPRDSLERRRGGRGGPAPRRDRKENGEKVQKRMNNNYNSNFKKDSASGTKDGRVEKKKGFNPMARAHMGSDAYKGHAKKLKAELIHKAKVKKEYAKVLTKEEENTPEFYKKIFGEKTIDDEGNIVAYKGDEDEEDNDENDQKDEDMSRSDEDENMQESGSDNEEEEEEEEEVKPSKNSKGKKGAAATKTQTKPGKQDDGTFKRAHKPNPFKAAIEKREAEKKAIQEARDRAQRERALAKKGRDAYYANREKTTRKMREKTSRGQPVLANQIKMMLGKIKEDITENKTRAPVQRWGGRGGRKNAGRGTARGVKKGASSAHREA